MPHVLVYPIYTPWIIHTHPMHTICSHVLCNTYKIYIAHTCHLINHIAYILHIVHNSTDRPQVPYLHYSHPMLPIHATHTSYTPASFPEVRDGRLHLVHPCLGYPSFLPECCFLAPLSPVALPTTMPQAREVNVCTACFLTTQEPSRS